MLVDMPLDQLREYRPEPEEPADFDAFWKQTLDDAAGRFEPYAARLATVHVQDVTFSGWGGQPVKAWRDHRWDDGLAGERTARDRTDLRAGDLGCQWSDHNAADDGDAGDPP